MVYMLRKTYTSYILPKLCGRQILQLLYGAGGKMQAKEVNSGAFEPRTIDTHNQQVQEVKQDPTVAKQYGVKGGCVLTDGLGHFHVVRGYPPDILHDLLEGIVPVELSLCISDMYF